jgi:hypothetical protein
LQHGAGLEQVEPNRSAVPLVMLPEMDRDGVFLDRAAVMQHLDLIITSDTSMAHLAGGLGRPVWLLLGTNADWRWLRGRAGSPWYPTMRIFRQRTWGDWSGVLADAAGALRERVAGLPQEVMPLSVPMSAGELLDRIVVLQRRAALGHSAQELERMQELRRKHIRPSEEIDASFTALERVHEDCATTERNLEEQLRKGHRKTTIAKLVLRLDQCRDERNRLVERINRAV